MSRNNVTENGINVNLSRIIFRSKSVTKIISKNIATKSRWGSAKPTK